MTNTIIILNTPHSHNSATTDVKTKPKLIKHRGGESLREDVDELRCRRDMEDADLTDDNPLGQNEDQSPHAWCVDVEWGWWIGTRR
jgi:hypothetical protein